MNPTIITIIIATATFLLGIFGALQFYSSRMEKYIDAKVEGLRAEIQAVRAETRTEFQAVRAEIQSVRAEIQAVNSRINDGTYLAWL